MADIDGLLTTTRKVGDLHGHKKFYAKNHPPVKDLLEIVKEIKPTVRKKRLRFKDFSVTVFHFYTDLNWCIRHTWSFHSTNSARNGCLQSTANYFRSFQSNKSSRMYS